MSKQDGGPAFARSGANIDLLDGSQTVINPQGGMSVREYLAAHALQGAVARDGCAHILMTGQVKYCWKLADAMIAERNKVADGHE